MSKTLDESTVLQGMSTDTRMKQFTALLNGKSVPTQDGGMIAIPGLDEQYIEQQCIVEGQRSLVDGNRVALKAEQGEKSGDSSMEQELARNLRLSIVNLMLMENKLTALGEQITTIRRRIKELEEAGTK